MVKGIQVDIKLDLPGFDLDISFKEDSGRLGILGASGSGKSLTLKAIAGIIKPDSGKVILNGKTLYDSCCKVDIKPQKRNVGYLFQNYALFPNMSVEENIAAGIKLKDRDKIRETVNGIIKRFRLEGLEKRLPSELSGGQQQRVALARIMAYEPDLILLDEPFSALDAYLKDRMQEELTEFLSDYSGTVILVSHSRDEIYRFSEKLLIIDINHGKTTEVFKNPRTLPAARLTGCKNFSKVSVQNEHTLYASDWGITLNLKNKISPDTEYIGYRAHDFLPVWGEREENTLPFILSSRAELQFERNYYLLPSKGAAGSDALIVWSAQKHLWEELDQKGLPNSLKICEEHLLLLKEK